MNVSYHYHLPFEEQFRCMDQADAEKLPETIRKDPLVRSSFFWALRHGDVETKLQVIQVFSLLADHEVKVALKEFLLDPEEDEYLKRVGLFALRSMQEEGPFRIQLGGVLMELDNRPYAPSLEVWDDRWTEVLDLAYESMNKRYDLVQQYDLETLWVEFLTRTQIKRLRMSAPEGWAAALEYLIAKMHRRPVTYDEMVLRHDVSPSTIRTCIKHIDEACQLRDKMKAILSVPEAVKGDGQQPDT